MSEWIEADVEKALESQIVICYGQYGDDDHDDDKYTFEGYVNSKGIWYAINNGDYIDGGYGNDYRARVTHWMPLPEPPKE